MREREGGEGEGKECVNERDKGTFMSKVKWISLL